MTVNSTSRRHPLEGCGGEGEGGGGGGGAYNGESEKRRGLERGREEDDD